MKMNKILAIYIILIICNSTSYSQITTWKPKIIDSTEYDAGFLIYWEHVKPFDLIITHDSIIVNNEKNNPILIPTDLPKNSDVHYTCIEDGVLYKLTVRRVNYTNLQYEINGILNFDTIFSRHGTAILNPSFYLGSEGIFEKSKDEIYSMNVYNIIIDKQVEAKLLVPYGTYEIIDYIEDQNNLRISLSFKKLQ